MAEKTYLKINLIGARTKACESFEKYLEESNKIWHSILRLIITLSSSCLVLTIAVVEKLFPSIEGTTTLPPFLIASWILFFVSIIFGIIAELNESIFFSNQANEFAKTIKGYNQKIAQGKLEDTYIEDKATPYIDYGAIFWGATSIDAFIIAILCICIALLKKIFSSIICGSILIIGILFLIGVNIYLINKRKK